MENLGTKLPNNPSYWDGIILNELGKKSPALASTMVSSVVKESDYPNGNLTALIVAANGKVLIPLVVRGFRVKPFDVFIYGDKILALTDRSVSAAIFSPEVSGGKLVNPQDLQTGTGISGLLSPPNTASGGFATPGNYYNKMAAEKRTPSRGISVLNALKLAGNTTKRAFAAGLSNNRLLLEKVAALLPVREIVSSCLNGLNDPGSSNGLIGLNCLTYIKSAGDSYTVNGSLKSASELMGLPEEIKASLLLTGEALVAPEDTKAEITVLTRKGLQPLKNTTLANVVCREGDSLSGVFLANVISFDHNPTRKGLFLTNDRQWIYQEQLAGRVVEVGHTLNPEVDVSWFQSSTSPESGCNNDIILSYNSLIKYLEQFDKTEDIPRIGEYGTFIPVSGKAAKTVIEPFKVISLYNVSGSVVMSVAASSGQRLVVEYRFQSSTSPESGCNNDGTLPNQQPLMVASGSLVSKYFPTDRVYIVNYPYRYVSLKAQRHGARTPEEALIIPLEDEGGDFGLRIADCGLSNPKSKLQIPKLRGRDSCIITIKKASGGYCVSRDSRYEGRRTSDLLPSKLACHYELARLGIGTKQAEVLTNLSPVSFVLNQNSKKASNGLPTRHRGSELPETVPPSYPRLFTNNTEQGQFIEQGALNTAAMLDDPETLNILLTIGMAEMDDKVRQYVISNTGDIRDLIDKLGRLLLIIRTSENTGISETALSDLVQKLDRVAWELTDFNGRRHTPESREDTVDE